MRYEASTDPEAPRVFDRVWRDGQDVTCEPVQTWPPYQQRYFLEGWRPKLYPGESVEWPDPATLRVKSQTRTRAGRSARHG